MTRKTKISGNLLIATGILHNVIGVVMGFAVLAAIGNAGVLNSVGEQFDRMAIFWFLFAGFGMMMWGDLLRKLDDVPRSFGWSLLVLCIVGAAMMPASGFWLVIPQALYMLFAPAPQTPATA